MSESQAVPGKGWLSANIRETALYSTGRKSVRVGHTWVTMGMNDEAAMAAMSAAKE